MTEIVSQDSQPVAGSSKGRIAVDMDDVLWSVPFLMVAMELMK